MTKFSVTEQTLEEESYFVSMTDMMVGLLFIFILILMYFALQFQKSNEQLQNANGTRAELLEDIGKKLEAEGITVKVYAQSGILQLSEDSLRFPSGSAEIQPVYNNVIKGLSNALGDVIPCYANEESLTNNPKCLDKNKSKHWLEAVFIEGHTDNVPVSRSLSRYASNLELSTARAANTYAAIVQSRSDIELLKNVDKQPLLSVSGYGDKRPALGAELNDTPEHKRTNRRIEIRFIMATPKNDDENVNSVVVKDVQKELQ